MYGTLPSYLPDVSLVAISNKKSSVHTSETIAILLISVLLNSDGQLLKLVS